MRNVVVLMPSGFTLANLLFGIWAIVSASRGEFDKAGLYVVLGGIADAFDGRVARATGTGSRFGEELDSLVDAISFGVAPAMIMYFAVLNKDGGDWIWAFLFVACAVIRLARFNVEQAGRAKTHFYGLPSPAAGMTLATYYWFSQTDLYTQTVIGNLPWQQTMRYVMLGLGLLMITNVQYPAVPRIGLRTWRGLVGTAVVVTTIIGVLFFPWKFFFPALILYVTYGLVKTALLGLIDRRPGGIPRQDLGDDDDDDELIGGDRELYGMPGDDDDSDDDEEDEPVEPIPPPVIPAARRKRRRKPRGAGGASDPQRRGGTPPSQKPQSPQPPPPANPNMKEE